MTTNFKKKLFVSLMLLNFVSLHCLLLVICNERRHIRCQLKADKVIQKCNTKLVYKKMHAEINSI